MMKQNLTYKLLALATAIVIWAYANKDQNVGGPVERNSAERPMKINLRVAASPPLGYRFSTPQLSPDLAIVSGPSKSVDTVNRLIVVLNRIDPGARNVEGSYLIIPLDKRGNRVQDVEVIPSKARVRQELLEAPASRRVFVSPDAVGQPPFPYRVDRIAVHPETVSVMGRPERLINVCTLKTEPVRLERRRNTFSQRVRVMAPAGLKLADGRYVRVTVSISSPPQPRNRPADR